MKKSALSINGLLIFIFILLFSAPLNSQSFTNFLNHLNALSDPVLKKDLVDSFMLANPVLPYIIENEATFIYREDAQKVAIQSDFNGWDHQASLMTRAEDTDLWYYTGNFELDARLDYDFVLDGTTVILDPNNPLKQQYSPTGFNSVLAMPSYIWPWEINDFGAPAGSIEEFNISSVHTGNDYLIKVYLPPDYAENGDPYPSAYFNDGNLYIALPHVINNLIDSGLVKDMIAVYIYPNNRDQEFYDSLHDEYRLFVVEELVPYVDLNYNTKTEVNSRAIIGVSAGGNISALIGYHHPDVFANVGLHSAAFVYNNWATYNLIVSGQKKEIKWASVCGSYDFPWLYNSMENFKDELLSIGYEVDWYTYPEGHSFGLWSAKIDDLLISFFSPSVSSNQWIEAENLNSIFIGPNPAHDMVELEIKMNKTGSVYFEITDLKGRILEKSNLGILRSGNHILPINIGNYNPGIYLISIQCKTEKIITKLMVY